MVTLADIQAAAERIAGKVLRSPTSYSANLSALTGCQIFCKLDSLQMTGSFKERGARNRLELIPSDQRAAGVIAASAGNHALALAYHGHALNIPVRVVMPVWAPLIKVENCRRHGAEIVLSGETYDDAKAEALRQASTSGALYVPGFDDDAIIAGQGTLGLELLNEVADLDAIIVPVGGGGLIAGIGIAVRALQPHIRVIGVEPAHAPSATAALAAGKPVRVETQPTLADGLGVACIGERCWEPLRDTVEQVVTVDEAAIAQAVLRLVEHEKAVVEGAAACALAAVLRHDLGLRGKRVALVLCGGNIDPTVLSRVIERGLAADGRLCRVRANIIDRPGSLARFLQIIAQVGGSVREVRHDRSFAPGDVALVNITCLIETRDHAHCRELEAAFTAAGIRATVQTSAEN